MTKFNWEKANKQTRQQKYLFAFDQLGGGFTNERMEAFDITNTTHNPLGLSDDDCRGKIPSQEKRNLIVKYLANNSDLKFLEIDSIHTSADISAKNFYEFSWKIFTSDFDWAQNKPPIKYLMPIAVCFSVVYLRIYNTVISPNEKASALTLEIIAMMNAHQKTLSNH